MKTIVIDVLGQIDVEAEAISCVEKFLRDRGFDVDVQCPNGLVAVISAQTVEPAQAQELPSSMPPSAEMEITPVELPPVSVEPTVEPVSSVPSQVVQDFGTCKLWNLSTTNVIPCIYDPSCAISQLHVDSNCEQIGDCVCFSYCGAEFKVPIANSMTAPTEQCANQGMQLTPTSIRSAISVNDSSNLYSCVLQVVTSSDGCRLVIGQDLQHICQ